MRGRPGCPTGREKNVVEATAVILFSTRKGWVQDRPLIRPSVRTGAPSPRGEGFGRGKPSYRVSNPLPSNGLARQGSRSGRQPAKRPEGPNPPFRPTDSPGRARLAEFRRPQPAEKDKIMF